MTNQHPIDPPVFDFRGVNFNGYDEDYADAGRSVSEREPPPLPFFEKLKNDEIRQKVEQWGKKGLTMTMVMGDVKITLAPTLAPASQQYTSDFFMRCKLSLFLM